MPDNIPNISPASRYTHLLTLVFLLIALILASVVTANIEEATRRQMGDSLQTVLGTTVTTYKTWIEYRKRAVTELASNPTLVELTQQLLQADIDNRFPALIPLRQFIKPKLDRVGDQGFFLIAPDHTNIASMRDNNLNRINLIHRQRPGYLEQVFEGHTLFIPTVHSDVPLSENGNRQSLSVFVATPIMVSEDVVAVLAISINFETVFQQVSALGRLGETGETYAFDRQGTLITASRFEEQLRQLGLVSGDDKANLNIRISDPGGDLTKGYKPETELQEPPLTVMAASATQGESSFNIDGYRDYRGVPVFGAWLWDADLGVGMATEIDVEKALQPYYQTRRTLWGVLAITVILALLLIQHISRIQRQQKQELKKAYDNLEIRVQERTRELDDARCSLEAANRDLKLLATTDALTSLANRRSLDTHLQQEWQRGRRNKYNLGIVIIDIDYFKDYNDHYGHLMGDNCLQTVAQTLRDLPNVRRPGDLIARYGGEEFMIVLSNPSPEFMVTLSEQVRQAIFDLDIEHQASPLPGKRITISSGYALASCLDLKSPQDLIKQADNALYQAKQQGRNQSCSATVPASNKATN